MKEMKKTKTKMNWKAEAIYNFVEYLKDTENITGFDILCTKFVTTKHIKDFINIIDIDYFEETYNHDVEDMEIFLKSVFID